MDRMQVLADKLQISKVQTSAIASTVALLKDLVSQTNFPSEYAAVYMEVQIDGLANGDAALREKLVAAGCFLIDNLKPMAADGESTIAAQDKAEQSLTPEQQAALMAEAVAAIAKAGGRHGLN